LKTELRSILWYKKYQYRAKFYLPGINRTYNCKNFLAFLERLERQVVDVTESGKQNWRLVNDPNYDTHFLSEINSIDLDSIEKYLEWRDANKEQSLIRSEMNSASVFSNDLALLRTLEDICPTLRGNITYTTADPSVPTGVKYFVKEPKRKFRVYLRAVRLDPGKLTFRDDLKDFVLRYKNTKSEMFPCSSLKNWLFGQTTSRFGYSQWRLKYCSDHFYLEFDEPSTHALLALMFSDMLSSHYKLEKRPV
jgi:hypothetical protein